MTASVSRPNISVDGESLDKHLTCERGELKIHLHDSELMPLCAAAAIAWGYGVDYPSLKLDSVELDRHLLRMEALLHCLIPVYGENPRKVRKADLYEAIKGLRCAPLPLEWWTRRQLQK